jgi:hypothetical protein
VYRLLNLLGFVAFKMGRRQRGEAPAPPQPGGLRGFWPGALLLVGQRPLRVFSLLAPRTRPKSAAALLYEPRTWCTSPQ